MSGDPEEGPADDGRPDFDPAKAAELLGKYVILGITINDCNDNLIRQEQYHGVITDVDERSGITIALKGVRDGETYTLPPALEAFQSAKPGIYTFRSTGEDVRDPDYESTWTVTEPHPENRPTGSEDGPEAGDPPGFQA